MTHEPSDPLAEEVRETLSIGIWASTALLAIGLVLAVLEGEWTSSAAGVPSALRGLWGGLLEGRGTSIILLGIAVVLATPIARVAVSLGYFARARDLPFVAMTAFVLSVLALTVYLGIVA